MAVAFGVLVPSADADTLVALPLQVDFQDAASTPAAGYVADSGAAYDADRGYGWVNETTGAPLSIVGNGRDRNVVADARLDTFIHMQLPAGVDGVPTNAAWKANVPNGAYSITVAAGDPSYTDSRHVVRAEGLTLLDFAPASIATAQQANTATINVADNVLNIDAIGGTNTKIDYITITPTTSSTPTIISVDPNNGTTNNFRDVAVTIRTSNGVGAGTAKSDTFKVLDPNNNPVAGFYNVDGAYSNASFQPSALLTPNAKYTVQVTSGLKDVSGNAYAPFTSTFTTGTAVSTQSANVSFATSTFDSGTETPGPMAITKGADGKLYIAYNNGAIVAYNLDANGNKTGTATQINQFKMKRLISGLTFDPASTASNMTLYVTNNQNDCDLASTGKACDDFTGKISRISGNSTTLATATVQDVITGLPRSVGDHMTNGTAFGPDGSLYIAQGAQNGYGATDVTWGQRAETRLSAAVLKADVRTITSAVNVQTTAPVNYDPTAAGAKVALYATGIRNPYALAWGASGANAGKLYAPVNESSNGNTPADPAGGAPALSGLPSFNDYFTQVVSGKYYGHPNPVRGEYRLNGGNPTGGTDPFEVPQYPVGTQPNANWYQPDIDLGNHRSANGIAEFTSNVFGANLQGQFLVTEYAGGKDVIAIKTDANGKPVSKTVVAAGFYNPLPIYVDNATGRVYVGEYGSEVGGNGGKVTLLSPNGVTPPNPNPGTGTSWKVNFGPQNATAVTGYSLDYGQAFDATRGYGWLGQTTNVPLSLTDFGRERNIVTDKRFDSFMHMQHVDSTTPGKWELVVPNGTYNLTIGVGDPNNANLDSTPHLLRAEGQTVGSYTPVAATPQTTFTGTVVVSDGRLTVDAIGGVNTKIAYIDVLQQSTGNPTDPNPGTNTLKVDFTTQTGSLAAGYTRDYGLAYSGTAGFGWLDNATNAPVSMVGNARERNVVSDKRLDTFTHLQLGATSDGVKTVGKWEAAVANGTYNVTVGVGDTSYLDSVHVIRAEGTEIIRHTPTASVPQKTVTASVVVADGKLTLDPTGGSNTKLGFVDIVPSTGTNPPAQADTTAPAVIINVSGSSNASGQYLGAASVTIAATDASGIASTVYSVSGTSTVAEKAYAGAFQISGAGTYNITAKSTDKATPVANVTTQQRAITIVPVGGGGGTGSLAVTTPEDMLGLGSRLVFSTVKNEARTGHSATLINNGTAPLTVTSLSFSGPNAAEFQLCANQATTLTIPAKGSANVCVQYRPNRAFNGIVTNLSSANLLVAHSASATPYTITLGGLSTSNYEGNDEASIQDMFTALGYGTNAGMTFLPHAKSVSPASTPVGDEVLAPYFLRADGSKPVTLIPTGHYQGFDYYTDWKIGYNAKGSKNLTNLFNYQVGPQYNGYGENQLMLPKIDGTMQLPADLTTPFGFGDTDGTYTDDELNEGKFHNWRTYVAKTPNGTVIPNTYLIGTDIGSPWENPNKNWDYQDFTFVVTNVKIDSATQPAAGLVNRNFEFSGNDGGQLGTGFAAFQGASTSSDISLSGGRLNVKSSADSNTAHRNALMSPVHMGSNLAIQARLVGPFTNINAGEEQQAIWFGPNATNYAKFEIENSGNANKKRLTFWVQKGSTGAVVNTVDIDTAGLNTLDLKFDINPALRDGPRITASYSVNGGAFTALTRDYDGIPKEWMTQATPAGVLQSHQGTGGAQFTAVYEYFRVNRT
jgi:hypothetical protein